VTARLSASLVPRKARLDAPSENSLGATSTAEVGQIAAGPPLISSWSLPNKNFFSPNESDRGRPGNSSISSSSFRNTQRASRSGFECVGRSDAAPLEYARSEFVLGFSSGQHPVAVEIELAPPGSRGLRTGLGHGSRVPRTANYNTGRRAIAAPPHRAH